MISIEESPYTYEYKNYFKILPQVSDNYKKYNVRKKLGTKKFIYRSDINQKWMSKGELQNG